MAVIGGNQINHERLYVGMVPDMRTSVNVTKINSTNNTIEFGMAVVSDGDDGAKLPVAASTALNFIGVVRYEMNRAHQDDEVFGASVDRSMTVVTHGVIAVAPTVNVDRDDPVYFIVGDGTGSNEGRFSNVESSDAELGVLLPNAKWTESALADEATVLSLGIGG